VEVAIAKVLFVMVGTETKELAVNVPKLRTTVTKVPVETTVPAVTVWEITNPAATVELLT
jgi:hypothetical protein